MGDAVATKSQHLLLVQITQKYIIVEFIERWC